MKITTKRDVNHLTPPVLSSPTVFRIGSQTVLPIVVIIATLHHQKSKMITLLWHRVSRERTRFVSGNRTPHLHDSIALVMGATRNIETEISSLPPHRACANERLSLKPVATQARHMFDRISHSASADHQDTFETMLQTCSEPFSRVKVCSITAWAYMRCREADLHPRDLRCEQVRQ